MSTGAATRSPRQPDAYRRLRAITIHQPWAQLITCGLKRLETRSWPTKYRGPIAIHAAAATNFGGATLTIAQFKDLVRRCVARGLGCDCGHRGTDHDEVVGCLRSCPCRRLSPAWPLGAIVATARLVDCIPIIDYRDRVEGPHCDHSRHQHRARFFANGGGLVLWQCWGGSQDEQGDYSDQRPFGDFAPGRYAWLLDDIKPTTERCPGCWGDSEGWIWAPGMPSPCRACDRKGTCDPIPAKGQRRLWYWSPDGQDARHA